MTFELPVVPRSSRTAVLYLLLLLAFDVFFAWWILGPLLGPLASMLAGLRDFAVTPFVFGALFTGFALWVFGPALELTMMMAQSALSPVPLLEIRPDGLVDRRILRRVARWDEFEPVGERRHFLGSLGMPVESSFRLRDSSLRRWSPISALQSRTLGGKRVFIATYGLDVPPRVILDIILAMIKENQAPNR